MAQRINRSKLFVCASCEWIFKDNKNGCPKCGFAYYGAHFCYGSKAYSYFKMQKPWIDKQMSEKLYELQKEVKKSSEYIEIDRRPFFWGK